MKNLLGWTLTLAAWPSTAPYFPQAPETAQKIPRVPDAAPGADPRADYDVQAYRIDLSIDPAAKRIDGEVAMEARACAAGLQRIRLDLAANLELSRVCIVESDFAARELPDGQSLVFSREKDFVDITLPVPLARDALVRIALHYAGSPAKADNFSGFHWEQTPQGQPWITTSCQGPGSHSWWPSKDSFWHPEDKPEHLYFNATVPKGLFAVCNGRLLERVSHGELETFRWRHDYPLETYSVALNIAPYVEVHQELELEGFEEFGGKLNFDYYVLPGHEERARLQFADVPKMLAAYGRAFGPFPFPRSKYALVETSFWGMEHSTCVAYGSSFPAWCKATGAQDRYASRNKFYDYILIHESAHEWWGNGVSAADWGDFWIHEGFGTYAEGVYLELTESRERAEEFFATQRALVDPKSSVYSGRGKDSDAAYNSQIYFKGAAVLHTLRQYVADDDAWWRTLRGFNLAFRYKNATTEDFRAQLERETKRDWKTFFDEWVFGSGYPVVDGTLRVEGKTIIIKAQNEGSSGSGFHLPVDLAWSEGGQQRSSRSWLAPGPNELRIECKAAPVGVKTVGLERLLGHLKLEVKD